MTQKSSVHHENRESCACLELWDGKPKLNWNWDSNANRKYGSASRREFAGEGSRFHLPRKEAFCRVFAGVGSFNLQKDADGNAASPCGSGRHFFEELESLGTTDEGLTNLGWQRVKRAWRPPLPISQDIEDVRVPLSA